LISPWIFLIHVGVQVHIRGFLSNNGRGGGGGGIMEYGAGHQLKRFLSN